MAQKKTQQKATAGKPRKGPKPPTFTLSADRKFDLLAMVTIRSLAEAGHAPAEKLAALKQKLREFELYEEEYLR